MSKVTDIENAIIDSIKNKVYNPGDKIMSENTILEVFSVSRMTARKAIQNLVSRGYLYQRRGSGTFVANREDKIELYLDEMIGFTDRLRKQGKNPATKVLKFEVKKSDPILANKLKIEDGAEVYYVVRVRYMSDIPIALEYSYMPKALIKEMKPEDIEVSKYQYLRKKGFKIGNAVREYFPTVPSKSVKEILELPNAAATLKIELVSFLADGTPFEFSKIFYNHNKCKFIQISKPSELD